MTGLLYVEKAETALPRIEECSIDAVVTDPPYDLGFMGKDWDKMSVATHPDFWALVLRVLKPGGHCLVFGGTRTFHRVAVALEDAGFEIRDTMMWMYGQGFPKSMNVAQAIEKAGGSQEDVQRWDGWGTALKPAWEPIIMARKPFAGTVVQNVLANGVGGLNIDDSRIPYSGDADQLSATPQGRVTSKVGALAGGIQNDRNRNEFDRPELIGRFPANVVYSHHDDCVMVRFKRVKGSNTRPEHVGAGRDGNHTKGIYGAKESKVTISHVDQDGMEVVDHWECVDECPAKILDEQSGVTKSTGGRTANITPSGVYGGGSGIGSSATKTADEVRGDPGFGDIGGASRFFYQAKAAKKERPVYIDADGNKIAHPTVKPLDLVRYLVKMVTPPGGTVLDPFIGSGTTSEAAIIDGFNWVGVEMTKEYIPLIEQRVERAKKAVE
jgi:site-specific DNA-methyltransferase (adenine-specific)